MTMYKYSLLDLHLNCTFYIILGIVEIISKWPLEMLWKGAVFREISACKMAHILI